ncbi:MAG: non-homologous end-joining DNA ligase [Pseudomonadota bacterium]|jgi:DNA ligase D-like protein (predicted ligase)
MDVVEQLPAEIRKRVRRRKMPSWSSPILATLARGPFSDDGWIFERKLDGERCLAFVTAGKVRLLSRKRKELNDAYPEIEKEMGSAGLSDFIVDGEVVAFRKGRTSFSRLQSRMQIRDRDEAIKLSRKVAVFYYVFDLVHFDGRDLTRVPLRHRKGILKRIMTFRDPVRYTSHRNCDGESVYREACRKGWEGVIAKKADSVYRHSRSREWLKFKCVNRQEFVVGGYTKPGGRRQDFGAVLIGYYRDQDLVYAGKVGTGFSEKMLGDLKKKFDSRERKTSPFVSGAPGTNGVTWLSPQLVVEVGFTEWTERGRLRHPRYLGLRDDKDPRDVVRENVEG